LLSRQLGGNCFGLHRFRKCFNGIIARSLLEGRWRSDTPFASAFEHCRSVVERYRSVLIGRACAPRRDGGLEDDRRSGLRVPGGRRQCDIDRRRRDGEVFSLRSCGRVVGLLCEADDNILIAGWRFGDGELCVIGRRKRRRFPTRPSGTSIAGIAWAFGSSLNSPSPHAARANERTSRGGQAFSILPSAAVHDWPANRKLLIHFCTPRGDNREGVTRFVAGRVAAT
jgi:hypothetical protein